MLIPKGYTSNADAGLYTVDIRLWDKVDELEQKYTISLTIFEAEIKEEKVECQQNQELVCHVQEIDGEEVDKCECQDVDIINQCKEENLVCRVEEVDGVETNKCECKDELAQCSEEEIVCQIKDIDGVETEICECKEKEEEC